MWRFALQKRVSSGRTGRELGNYPSAPSQLHRTSTLLGTWRTAVMKPVFYMQDVLELVQEISLPCSAVPLRCNVCGGAGRDRACTGDICGQDGGGHGGTAGLPIQRARIQAGFCPPCSSNLTPVDQQPSSTCPLLQYVCGTYSLCKHVSNLKGSGQAHSSQGPMWRTVCIGTALSDAHLSGSSISPQQKRCAMHFPRRRAG